MILPKSNISMGSKITICALLMAANVARIEPVPNYLKAVGSEAASDFCMRRHDGPYVVGCIPEFVTCVNKMSFVMFCPDGFFFDERLNKCFPKWHASSCYGHSHHGPPHGILSPSVPVEPEDSEFCKHLPDGDYSIGCTSCYIACTDGYANAMECPARLVLDEALGTRVERAYVSVCGGTPTTAEPTTTPTTKETTEAAATAEPTTSEPTTKQTTVVAPDIIVTTPSRPCGSNYELFFCCEGKPDGQYSLGCSSVYAVCISGKTYIHKCGGFRRFDVITQQCMEKCRMRECECRPTTTITTAMIITTIPTTTTTLLASEANTLTTTAFPHFCKSHPDGSYNIGCSTSYITCLSGHITVKRCLGSAKFDIETIRCRPKCYVKECGCRPRPTITTRTTATTTATINTASPGSEAITFATTAAAQGPCRHRDNGLFSMGYSQRFLACLNGRPSYYFCKRGLTFHQRRQICLPKFLIEAVDVLDHEAHLQVRRIDFKLDQYEWQSIEQDEWENVGRRCYLLSESDFLETLSNKKLRVRALAHDGSLHSCDVGLSSFHLQQGVAYCKGAMELFTSVNSTRSISIHAAMRIFNVDSVHPIPVHRSFIAVSRAVQTFRTQVGHKRIQVQPARKNVATQVNERKAASTDVSVQCTARWYHEQVQKAVTEVVTRILTSGRMLPIMRRRRNHETGNHPTTRPNRSLVAVPQLRRLGTNIPVGRRVPRWIPSSGPYSTTAIGFNVICRNQLIRTLDRIIAYKQKLSTQQRKAPTVIERPVVRRICRVANQPLDTDGVFKSGQIVRSKRVESIQKPHVRMSEKVSIDEPQSKHSSPTPSMNSTISSNAAPSSRSHRKRSSSRRRSSNSATGSDKASGSEKGTSENSATSISSSSSNSTSHGELSSLDEHDSNSLPSI